MQEVLIEDVANQLGLLFALLPTPARAGAPPAPRPDWLPHYDLDIRLDVCGHAAHVGRSDAGLRGISSAARTFRLSTRTARGACGRPYRVRSPRPPELP